jgi:hypothetical protein
MIRNQRELRDTFVVKCVEWLLTASQKLTPFYWASKRHNSFFFVDVWVLGWLACSIAAYTISFAPLGGIVKWAIFLLTAIRVFEYTTYLFGVVLFPRAKKGTADIRSARRLLILLASNYLETVFWFATIYSLLASELLLKVTGEPHSISILRESLMLMVANWSGNFTILSWQAWVVVTVQDFLGLTLTLIVVARIISILPKPSSADSDEV